MSTAYSFSFQYGKHTVKLETGEIARHATGSVLVTMGGTTVLVAVVAAKDAVPGRDFFPLTVHYQERMYAAGRIPGGFFKREGRPTEYESLTSRLIDRPLRPLFPEGFLNEVQIVATMVSCDPTVEPDVPALIGASAALAISGIPFEGPVAVARVGYSAEGEFLLNPSSEELKTSLLDLIVAGTESSVLMVESEAKELPEQTMLEAVMFGHRQMQVVIQAIQDFARHTAKPPMEWAPAAANVALKAAVKAQAGTALERAYSIQEKYLRQDALNVLKAQMVEHFTADAAYTKEQVQSEFHELERDIVRGRILSGELRIDGRDTETVRPIAIRTGVLPRTHGSALFTRGETQALVIATLGTGRDAQVLDNPVGEKKENFMLHYNFPPYCVGETGMMSGPKRREIGHGRLAKRGVQAVLPTDDEFPYVIRVVSEITESNGSSSMASVCGSSLALMDAGVPLKAPVAGIAMGLVKENDRFAVLTDILGDEDHLGDMDFKVAGTADGITALQMDIKINGITREIMQVALDQARTGRLHILTQMNAVMATPRVELSDFAPRMLTFKINPEKIRDVIGKGGATIRALTEETGASIDINDEGRIVIVAVDAASSEAVRQRIHSLTAEVEVGKVYTGKVARLADFGAFVTILPGKDGLVHVSQMSAERVENVADFVQVGQEVQVKVLEIDRQGRVRLSMKDVEDSPADQDLA